MFRFRALLADTPNLIATDECVRVCTGYAGGWLEVSRALAEQSAGLCAGELEKLKHESVILGGLATVPHAQPTAYVPGPDVVWVD